MKRPRQTDNPLCVTIFDRCRSFYAAILPSFLIIISCFGFASGLDAFDAPPSDAKGERVEVIPPASANGSETSEPELVILGIYPADTPIAAIPADHSRLIQIPIAGAADRVPSLADTTPNLADSGSNPPESESAAESSPERFFVCRLNRLAPKEQLLLDDAQDGRWDDISFLEAVLIAEGTSESERAGSMRIFSRLTEELDPLLISVEDETEKAKVVFEFLHRRVLTGPYDLNRSSAAVSLATGLYNCVSATVLFNALAERAGLRADGLETTGHAKSRLIFADLTLDIETTCTHWDLLPDKPVRRSETTTVARPIPATDGEERPEGAENQEGEMSDGGRLDAESTVPNADDLAHSTPTGSVRYRKRPVREVSPVEFVATIYYNKGVDFYQEKKFGPAIAAYLKATTLDPGNKTVLGNLKATLNNLAIELAMRKNFAEAIRLTEQGLAIDPQFDQFRVNLPLYYRHWSDQLRQAGDTRQAERIDRLVERRFASDADSR